MFSKEESQQIKRQFWIAFAEEYPRKWLLYNTRIKDVSFKFYADNKIAQVVLDIECKDEELRKIYFEKIESLKSILQSDFLPKVIFDKNFLLENQKSISRIYVEISNVSIHNTKTWKTIFDFFSENMDLFERFFYEYEDYIRDLEINT